MLFKCPTNFCVNLCSHSSHILPFESQFVQMLRYFCQQLVTTILVVALKSLLGCQILRSFYLQLSPILQNDVMKVAAVIHLEKNQTGRFVLQLRSQISAMLSLQCIGKVGGTS